MTPAQNLLGRGMNVVAAQFPEPFTVDGFREEFSGNMEEAVNSNTVDEGGFIPDAGGTLYVRMSEFAKVNLTPWAGMRLTVMGEEFIVSTVGRAYGKWRLVLGQSHPKTASNIPTFYHVVATTDGVPLLFTTGLVALNF